MSTTVPVPGAAAPQQASDPVCTPGTAFGDVVAAVRAAQVPLEEGADRLLAQLTDDELLWLLDGDEPIGRGMLQMARGYNRVPVVAGRVDRLGVPGIRFTDGPRGVVMGSSTAFPVAVARAASWDPALERAVGDVIGREARAQGANLFGGVCINLAYAPGWGRSQESYGEDPVLLGAMGSALVAGVSPWVMSTVKHLALNSMEEARFVVDVEADEDVLREVYLPHFRAVVEAGTDAVMSAYNSVNGEWAGENHHLLTEVLRQDWGFQGLVMSDFAWGLRHPVESVGAGQDLEMPFRQQRAHSLPDALADGRLPRSHVVTAARRILRAQLALAVRALPTPEPSVVASAEHRALAREVASRGTVLLRNEPVGQAGPLLPLDASTLGSLAVLGPLADAANQGDIGSSRVRPASTTSVLAGLRARLGDRVRHHDGKQLAAAVAAAKEADAAVVVVGLTSKDEGESMVAVDPDAFVVLGGPFRNRLVAGAASRLLNVMASIAPVGGDRSSLELHPDDVRLVGAVAAVQPRTVVVVIGGGTVVVDPWDRVVPALLMAWYPGMEGGHALADVLLGDAEPSGRLPLVIPHRAGDLPTVDWRARRIRYGRWWGQRKLDRDGVRAAYPLGFGLGYATPQLTGFGVSAVHAETFTATVTVTNASRRRGRHVVQVYATDTGRSGSVRNLVGFAPVELDPGAEVEVEVTCSTRPVQRWVEGRFLPPVGPVHLEAGSFSGDPAALTASLPLG